MDKTDETWRAGTDIPPVPKGSESEFIVAVQRARNDKVYSFAASYLNAAPLQYEYCPKDKDGFCNGCEDGCPTTGWYYQTGEDGGGSQYQSLELKDGDKLEGWRNVPQWPGSLG